MYDLNEQNKQNEQGKQQRLARVFAEQVLKSEESTPEERAAAEVVIENTAPLTMADVKWVKDKHYLAGATMDSKSGPLDVVMIAHDTSTIDYATLDKKVGRQNRARFTPNGKRYELRELVSEHERPIKPSTKTMDEYSPEEQDEMVGMWAKYDRRNGCDTDFVIIEGGVNQAGRVPCYNPEAPEPSAWAPDPWMLTPRFDLPRAWDKNGQPCEDAPAGAHQPKPDYPKTLSTAEDYENAPEDTVADIDGNVFLCGPRGWRSTNNYSTYSPEQMSNFSEGNVLRWGKTS